MVWSFNCHNYNTFKTVNITHSSGSCYEVKISSNVHLPSNFPIPSSLSYSVQYMRGFHF